MKKAQEELGENSFETERVEMSSDERFMAEGADSLVGLRRSSRERRPPVWLKDYIPGEDLTGKHKEIQKK